MGLFELGGEREAGEGGEVHHPGLVVGEGEGGEEAVEVVDGEDGGQRGEGVVSVDFQNPVDGFLSGWRERERDGGACLSLLEEEGLELLVFPEELLLQEKQWGEREGVIVIVVFIVFIDVAPFLFFAVEGGVEEGFLGGLLDSH